MKPETITVNGVKFDMMPVEGGTFLMGGTIKIATSPAMTSSRRTR